MERKNNSFRLPNVHGNAYQMWIGSKQIRRIMVGSKLVWPNNYVDGDDNSLSFNSSYNVIKDYTLSSSSIYERHEIDPGGGVAYFNVEAREDSNWHRVTSYMKIVNGSLHEVFLPNFHASRYIDFPTFSNSPESSSYPGPIITTTGYTYTVIPGDDATSSNIVRYAYIAPNMWCDTTVSYDLTIGIAVGPNNTPSIRTSYVYLYQYLDEFNNACSIPNGLTKPVVWLTQEPNIMYYTHYAWATSASTSSIVDTLDLTSLKYTDTSVTVYLFLEFGVSIDGGSTIYWNTLASSTTGNQSSVLPSDIANYIDVGITSDFTYTKGTLTNSNYVPVTISMSQNTSGNGQTQLFDDGLSNTSGNETSPAGYSDSTTSVSSVKVYYGVGTNDRVGSLSVSCTYPNHTF